MSASDFVTLRGGLTLPVDVLRLAWSLEDRGVTLEADGDDLSIGPRDYLTAADRVAIRRWKRHLLALVDYCSHDRGVQ